MCHFVLTFHEQITQNDGSTSSLELCKGDRAIVGLGTEISSMFFWHVEGPDLNSQVLKRKGYFAPCQLNLYKVLLFRYTLKRIGNFFYQFLLHLKINFEVHVSWDHELLISFIPSTHNQIWPWAKKLLYELSLWIFFSYHRNPCPTCASQTCSNCPKEHSCKEQNLIIVHNDFNAIIWTVIRIATFGVGVRCLSVSDHQCTNRLIP